MTNFERAFKFVIGEETEKFVNDPDDSGGPTKFGVTKRAYEFWIGHKVDISEIKNMTKETAERFYLETYWGPLHCDKILNYAKATAIFSSAVLYGLGTTAFLVQKTCNRMGAMLKIDGQLGDKSIKVLNDFGDAGFINSFHETIVSRIDWIVGSRPKDLKYRQGWINRANRLLTLVGK